MFKKILIANRGEIACRVIRTAKRLGIATVAVYSDADAEALHVREADEAVRIGPPPAAQSYLDGAAIIAACRRTGAEAVHPGYGFLSENPGFASALAAAGIVFIGPTPDAVAQMGDKIESKRLARTAGVATVPGHLGVVADAETAVRIAREIGYPVMIKASAGGGGKGMRVARDDAEIRDGFRSATNEARSSFGDERIFIEKYIEQPRHIEIQVLGDAHGTVIHLGERECSIQRRHQKVIEEAPSPFLDAATRAAMGAQAVALARAVGYRSAGTVEFIVDRARNFYFLEMNTRLQVEHPVTEEVTGLDLVELMIRIAAGERLPLRQDEVRLEGWAVEARLYAEDPRRGFLPAIGRLVRCRFPTGPGIRIETGVAEGAEITIHYDPMIAKLVATGADREAAIARLGTALDETFIRGPSHNIDFLAAIVATPRFRSGVLSTDLIAEEFPEGFIGGPPSGPDRETVVAVAAVLGSILAERDAQISGQIAERGLPGTPRPVAESWVVCIGRDQRPVTVATAEGGYRVGLVNASLDIATDWRPFEPLCRVGVSGRQLQFQFDRDGIGFRLTHGGSRTALRVLPPHVAALMAHMPERQPPDLSRHLLSPMPGLLVAIAVREGQEVKAGEELATVEAMKMENILRAACDGTVARIRAAPGDSLAVDDVILEFA